MQRDPQGGNIWLVSQLSGHEISQLPTITKDLRACAAIYGLKSMVKQVGPRPFKALLTNNRILK